MEVELAHLSATTVEAAEEDVIEITDVMIATTDVTGAIMIVATAVVLGIVITVKHLNFRTYLIPA